VPKCDIADARRAKEKPPDGGFNSNMMIASGRHQCGLWLPAIGREAGIELENAG
jgi:hypothetical protein